MWLHMYLYLHRCQSICICVNVPVDRQRTQTSCQLPYQPQRQPSQIQSRDRSANSWKMPRRAWLAVGLMPAAFFYFFLLTFCILAMPRVWLPVCVCLSHRQIPSTALRALAKLHTSAWALDSVTSNCISGVSSCFASLRLALPCHVWFRFLVFPFPIYCIPNRDFSIFLSLPQAPSHRIIFNPINLH